MKAVAYLRVSTEDQAESGLGLAAQEAAIRAYADRQGLTLGPIHRDEGISGSLGLERRPGLMAAISDLGRGDVLIVAKRDRLGRLDPLRMAMIEAAVSRRGARIVSAAGEGTDTDDPSAVLMRRMIDAFAEYERLVIASRTRAAMGAKRARGERVGAVPFGYRLASDGITLEADPVEQDIIRMIRDLRARGMSYRAICDALNTRGIASKQGGRWHLATIQRILAA